MHGDCALDEALRLRILPSSTLKGEANLLVCPNVDSGNIAYNLLKTAAGGNVAVGPFLLGANAPVHPDLQLDRAPHHQHDGHDGAGRQSRGNVGLSLAPGTRRRGSGQRVPQGSGPRWFRGYLAIETKRRPVCGPGGVYHSQPVPRDARRPASLVAAGLPAAVGLLAEPELPGLGGVGPREIAFQEAAGAIVLELGGLRRGELDRDRRRDLARARWTSWCSGRRRSCSARRRPPGGTRAGRPWGSA